MLRIVVPILDSNFFWITAVFVGVCLYIKFVIYAHWKKLGVPHTIPSLQLANVLPVALGFKSIADHLKENYDEFKKHRFSGMYMFHKPVLMINDPELIRQILVKDFNKFCDRGIYMNEKVDPLTNNIFFLSGEKWRKLRAKLTPTFTSSKMKEMFPLVKEISDELVKTCDKILREKGDVVEIKDLFGRYTVDSISSIAFGVKSNSLNNDDDEFKHYGLMAFDMSPIKIAIATFASIILDILRVPFLNKKMTNFFTTTFQNIIKYRRQNNIVRKDFLNLLIQLMDKGILDDDEESNSDQNKLSMNQAQAQAFVFFAAGYETSSSTMTYLLYELAMNPKVQDKLHHEIDEFFAKGDVTYDRVRSDLKYMDMVFSETLRKHSSFSSLNRMSVEDWHIPDTDIEIKKGTAITISITGIHHDPDIYPEPEKFDPTRFTEENIAKRSSYTYLPFGVGPKHCIGLRFGIMQSKLALLAFLSEYKVHTCEKTVIPVQYSKKSFVQTPGCGVYLRLEKRANRARKAQRSPEVSVGNCRFE